MTNFPDLFAALFAPFDPSEVRTRSQGGKTLHYITARTAMNRLDNVLGPENWWDEYVAGEHSVLCRLTIRFPDPDAAEGGGWIVLTKSDAGGYAGMPDQGDDDKSGYSDSFKRAAVKFGVGRYLYRDGVPTFATQGAGSNPEQEAPAPPSAPASPPSPRPATRYPLPASPAPDRDRLPSQARPPKVEPEPSRPPSVPRSGRALFAWTKEQEQRHEVGLLKYLNGWAKLQDFPARMVDWDNDQVNQAHAEACRKLRSISAGQTEVHEEALAS